MIIEERRSRIENNPSRILDEQMNAALYHSHPYGIPVIGWEHEMAKLSREDALRFYKRYLRAQQRHPRRRRRRRPPTR